MPGTSLSDVYHGADREGHGSVGRNRQGIYPGQVHADVGSGIPEDQGVVPGASVDRQSTTAAASIVVGLLLGAAAVFGVTLMVQQDTKPPLQAGDPASSVLNRVEYGDRS